LWHVTHTPPPCPFFVFFMVCSNQPQTWEEVIVHNSPLFHFTFFLFHFLCFIVDNHHWIDEIYLHPLV
jgi:hypothetical protein